MNSPVITVSQLNKYVKSVIDGDYNLSEVFVCGEISNCRLNYASGHYYFSLKDDSAVIKCAMFRSNAVRLKFQLLDGMEVLIRGRVSLYERDGTYQLYAEDVVANGIGNLAAQFEQTKKKLEREGLFDSATKRSLPKLPQKIAVLTAEQGAAKHDILNILGRRFPLCEVLFVPVTVQGENAAADIINKLDIVYKMQDIDIIILGRGGGSAEDLSCFNDEQMARKLKASPIPTVSAVGHESDFSITDFVADIRASTPSAAAELCVPESSDILQYIDSLKSSIEFRTKFIIDDCKFKVDSISNKKVFRAKGAAIDNLFEKLNEVNGKIALGYNSFVGENSEQFKLIAGKLSGLNPLSALDRGYSVTLKNGKQIKSIGNLQSNDIIKVRLSDGIAECTVNNTEEL